MLNCVLKPTLVHYFVVTHCFSLCVVRSTSTCHGWLSHWGRALVMHMCMLATKVIYGFAEIALQC